MIVQKYESILAGLRKNKIKRLEEKTKHKQKKLALKAKIQQSSHSLLWVWEFSKKAVLICFLFYIAVQMYAMVVMVIYDDFSCLGELLNQAGQICSDCVFGYLIKAGVENIGKIWFSYKRKAPHCYEYEDKESEVE